jgi:hypothetical protein
MKMPHLETVQSTVVVFVEYVPVGFNLITSEGKNDAPREFEIHNCTASLQMAGRVPAGASTHCWMYKPREAGTPRSMMLIVAP